MTKQELTQQNNDSKPSDEVRKLEKRGKDEYVLVLENLRYKTRNEKVYTKEELKDIYKSLKAHKKGVKAQIDEYKKQLKKHDPDAATQIEKMQDENPDQSEMFAKHKGLVEFMDIQERANRLAQYFNTLSQMKHIKVDLQRTNTEMAEIERAIPEFLRLK